MHRLLLLYTQALLTRMSQTAVYFRLHSVEQQLCRWLLLTHDRIASYELIMIQALLAGMLGVHREGVSFAAHRLQQAGLIDYHRGRIDTLNKRRLRAASCSCYGIIQRQYDSVIG